MPGFYSNQLLNFSLVAIDFIDVFRFLYVAVVRNDANINYPADLRDKISCHTGYGRTAGWHIPIPKVRFPSIIHIYSDCRFEFMSG